MNIEIKPLDKDDQFFLWEMLYQALYVPEGSNPLPKEIIYHPDLAKYVEKWGLASDIGLIAINKDIQEKVGAIWLRLFAKENKGYGFVDEHTPELTIAVVPDHRGKGVGTMLLAALLKKAKEKYSTISLSVSIDNPVIKLYTKFGFKKVDSNKDSMIMKKVLDD